MRETLISCLLHPNQWPGPEPRHVPWPGIEPATFWLVGQCPAHWASQGWGMAYSHLMLLLTLVGLGLPFCHLFSIVPSMFYTSIHLFLPSFCSVTFFMFFNFNCSFGFLNFNYINPGWCGSVDWMLACKPKGHQFNSQSRHMPGLQARSPVRGTQEATTHWCFSPSLSPSLPLSKNK